MAGSHAQNLPCQIWVRGWQKSIVITLATTDHKVNVIAFRRGHAVFTLPTPQRLFRWFCPVNTHWFPTSGSLLSHRCWQIKSEKSIWISNKLFILLFLRTNGGEKKERKKNLPRRDTSHFKELAHDLTSVCVAHGLQTNRQYLQITSASQCWNRESACSLSCLSYQTSFPQPLWINTIIWIFLENLYDIVLLEWFN